MNFFSSGFVLVWLFKTWYVIGVTFCTASCILKCHLCVCMCACMCLCCLELLNTNALYHHSPWGGSFVGLCQNSLLFYFFFLLCTKNFSGLDFHSTGRTLFRRTGHMSEELRCTSSLFLTPTQKPFQKPQKKFCRKSVINIYPQLISSSLLTSFFPDLLLLVS